MRTLLENIDTQAVAMALKSERPEMMEKFTSAMTERGASMLKEDMEFMGPCRLRDVIAAQNEISLAIEHLVENGKIKLPSDPAEGTDEQCREAVCGEVTSPNSEKSEDVFRSVIDYAITIRSGIRAFILKEAEEKKDAAILQEVQRILSMYSADGDRRAAECLWSKKREEMLGRIYSVSMKGEDGKLVEFLKCVPRAATQKALDKITEEDKCLRTVIRGSVLWWDDVLGVPTAAVREVMRHCTAPVIAMSLVDATSEVRDYMLTCMFYCDNTGLSPVACEHWARDVVRREMEGLIDEAAKVAASDEVEAARDEVLNAITWAGEVKERLAVC